MATKRCFQMTSNDIYFADSCFIGEKTAEEAMSAGVNYCGPVKRSHKDFCIATLEKLMKDWSGGSYIVMNSNPRVA